MHFMEYIRYHLDTFPKKVPCWNYEDGCVIMGSILLYQITGDTYFKDFVVNYMEEFIHSDGSIESYEMEAFNLDNVNSGRALFFLYNEIGDEKYKKAIKLLRKQLEIQPRTECNNFWHKNIYPWQIWLDGLYMAQPFYIMYEREFGSENYTDTISQFKNVRKLMFDPNKSLYYHGYDEKKVQKWADRETGLSKNFWLRAVGWYLISLIDVIDEMHMPDSEETRELSDIFNEAVDGILKYQDQKNKLFYQVIDHPQAAGNYLETSGSAMVAYALIKGSRLKVLDNSFYAVLGEEVLMELHNQKLKNANGIYELADICKVGGLGPNDTRDGSVEYYLSEPIVKDDHKGSGAFMMAYAQLLLWKAEHGASRDAHIETKGKEKK